MTDQHNPSSSPKQHSGNRLRPLLAFFSIIIGFIGFHFTFSSVTGDIKSLKASKEIQIGLSDHNKTELHAHEGNGRLDSVSLEEEAFKAYQKGDNTYLTKGFRQRIFLNERPELIRWLLFNSGLAAFSFTALLPLFFFGISIRNRYNISFWQIALSITLSGALLAGIQALFSHKNVSTYMLKSDELIDAFDLILVEPTSTINYIIVPPFLASFVALSVFFMVVWGANNTLSISGLLKESLSKRYKEIKGNLNALIGLLGILISGAIIGTLFFRQVFLAEVQGGDLLQPLIFPYAYGFIFTIALLLIYLPAYLFLVAIGRQAISKAEGSYQDLESNQHPLAILLDNLQVALSITLPIISVMIEQIIGLG